MRQSAFAIILAAFATSAGAAPTLVGEWSYGDGWTTTEFKEGADRWCATSSASRKLGLVDYQVVMAFGDRNEFALSTNAPIGTSKEGVFDIEGGGLDLGDVQYRRDGARYVAANSVSTSMFRKVMEDFRVSTKVAFELNGQRYSVTVTDSVKTYDGMIECQRSLLGMVIGDLK